MERTVARAAANLVRESVGSVPCTMKKLYKPLQILYLQRVGSSDLSLKLFLTVYLFSVKLLDNFDIMSK